MLIFVLLMDSQQKHSRLLTKEVVKIKPAICICSCHGFKIRHLFL